MKKAKPNYQPFLRFLLVVYGLVMLWLLFGRDSGWKEGYSYRELLDMRLSIHPLRTIRNYWYVIRNMPGSASWTHCVINLLGNVILFVPLGWLIPWVFPAQRKFIVFFTSCLFFDLLAEVVQLLTLLGIFDVDDILLNMSGLILGYLGYRLTHRKKKQK